jgi:hypothetical protein
MVQTDEKVIYSFLKGSFTVKNPNGASENDKGSSHLKDVDIESDSNCF